MGSSRPIRFRLAFLLLGCFLVSSMYIVKNTSFGRGNGRVKRSMKMADERTAGIADKHTATKQSTTAVNAIERNNKKVLPSFEDGGIIFFLHVPKTAGVTVRRALSKGFERRKDSQNTSQVGKYFLADRRRKFDKYKNAINNYVRNGTKGKELVVFELHASDSPTLMEVADRLQKWRRIATQNEVPFFAFTILREPMSFAVSFFNFYYGMDHGDPNYEYFDLPEEKDFVRKAVFNPQCGFLVKSDICFRKKETKKLTRDECDAAYQTLLDNMDWVGTADRLSNETFPLLRSLVATNMNADHLLPENIKRKNKSPKKISEEDLSQKAVDYVRNLTIWDFEMYERITDDFPYERMVVRDDTTLR